MKWPDFLWREPVDHTTAARLRAEQFSSMVRNTPGLMLANVCNSVALLAAFWGTPRFVDALYWGISVFLIAGYIYFSRRQRSTRGLATHHIDAKLRAVLNALALGSCWAALPFLFFQEVGSGTQVLVACLSAGMLAGGAFALASIPLAALCFAGPIAASSFVALVRAGEKDHLLAATVLIIYCAVLTRGIFTYAEQLKARVLSQVDAEAKAGLRTQKLQASGMHAIGGIASSIVHEVNQPLSAATTYLQATLKLLRMNPGSRCENPEEVLERAMVQISRAGQIVSNLRNFIMGIDPDRRALNLHLVIRENCEHFEETARKANIHLRLQLEAENDLIFADRVQIGQVLSNLIGNGIDAINGSSERELNISTFATGEGFIRTDVTDTGPGVAQHIRDHLFAPFMTTKATGMGVGLAISRSIIEAHQGKIWVEPRPSGGGKFCFTLPLAEGDPCASQTSV